MFKNFLNTVNKVRKSHMQQKDQQNPHVTKQWIFLLQSKDHATTRRAEAMLYSK